MVISLQREYFCLINVGGKAWQGCAYTGCTTTFGPGHFWCATCSLVVCKKCARNQAPSRMIYTMHCNAIVGHICSLNKNWCGKNVRTSKCNQHLEVARKKWSQNNVHREASKKWWNMQNIFPLYLNQHKLFSLRFLLADQNGKTWKMTKKWWDFLQKSSPYWNEKFMFSN